MAHWVDFNMRDALGRVPALIEGPELSEMYVGKPIVLEDDEGNICKAEVLEVIPERSLVFVKLQAGSSEPSRRADDIVALSRGA